LGEDAETGGVSPSGGKKEDKQYKAEFLGEPFFHHSGLSSEFKHNTWSKFFGAKGLAVYSYPNKGLCPPQSP
jgi:hypothetical protein